MSITSLPPHLFVILFGKLQATKLSVAMLLMSLLLFACSGSNNENSGSTQTPGVLSVSILTPDTDLTINSGESVMFSAEVQNASSDTNLSYSWDFGDGSNDHQQNPGAHVYNANVAQTYIVHLSVIDNGNNTSATAETRSISVNPVNPASNHAPTVAITSPVTVNNAITINENDSLNFVGSANDVDGDQLSYKWTIPGASVNGAPQTSFTVLSPGTLTFTTAGQYTVNFSAFDGKLNSNVASITVNVSATPVNHAPTVAITSPVTVNNTITINANDSLDFVGSANDIDGDQLSYKWTIPGASVNGAPQTSFDVLSPGLVTFHKAGQYNVSFSAFDGTVNSNIASISVSVINHKPTVSIVNPSTANNSIAILENESIDFIGAANDVDGDSLTYAWTIPGGSIPGGAAKTAYTVLSPGLVSFTSAGTYAISFVAYDGTDYSTPASFSVVVEKPVPLNEKIISLVELNDLHANLVAHSDFQRNADGSTQYVTRGGLARIAAMMNNIKTQNPDSVVMNIGDSFHGGVEAFYSSGNDVVDLVNLLPIDIGVPGNWDFIYGPLATRLRFTESTAMPPAGGVAGLNLGIFNIGSLSEIRKTKYPDLAENLQFTALCNFPRIAICQPVPIPGTWKKTVNGVTIGFIGITSDIVAMMHPILVTGMTFTQGEAAYQTLINNAANTLRTVPDTLPVADIVVVMSELGIHKDHRLAEIINPNSVDIFFSAHTHELVTTPIATASGAVVVEAGNDTYLGRMDVHWDATNKVINSLNWQILPVETSITPDPTVMAAVDAVRANYLSSAANPPSSANPFTDPSMYNSGQTLTMPIDTVLTTTNRPIDRRHSLENPFNNLMTDLLRNAYSSDIAMTPGFRFDTVLEGSPTVAKDFRLEDVYRFIPVVYHVATANITGANFKIAMEKNLAGVYSTTIFNQAGGWVNGYSGMTSNLNLANPNGQRVIDFTLYGATTPVAASDTLSVTGCIRPMEPTTDTLCTLGGFTNVVDQGISMIDFLTQQLQAGVLSMFSQRHDISDSASTLLWPNGAFIQPLNGAGAP